MLSNTSVVERSYGNTKRRLRSEGVSVMGLLDWFRRRKKRMPREEVTAVHEKPKKKRAQKKKKG
jgi:hypothetical protein